MFVCSVCFVIFARKRQNNTLRNPNHVDYEYEVEVDDRKRMEDSVKSCRRLLNMLVLSPQVQVQQVDGGSAHFIILSLLKFRHSFDTAVCLRYASRIFFLSRIETNNMVTSVQCA